jgi:hypothetical protein
MTEIGAVGGIHVAQADDVALDFYGAVPARDFLVVDDDVGVGPAYHHARLLHGVDKAAGRPAND